MSICGYLYRVDAGRLRELLGDPEQIPDLVMEYDVPEACSVEKAVYAIEFILARLAEAGRVPEVSPLTGGAKTGARLHYGPVWYRSPDEVRQLAGTLAGLSKREFRQGYLPEAMVESCVFPPIWDRPERDENFEYVWAWCEKMVRFYRDAAAAGQAVLLYLL